MKIKCSLEEDGDGVIVTATTNAFDSTVEGILEEEAYLSQILAMLYRLPFYDEEFLAGVDGGVLVCRFKAKLVGAFVWNSLANVVIEFSGVPSIF